MKTELLLNCIEKNENSTAPAWVYGAVIYQVFPDRFRNGSGAEDVRDDEYIYGEEYEDGPIPVRKVSWEIPVEVPDVCRFYGGDLPGILEKLPYLKQLGVEALYLNPVFVSRSNHKYDCVDYEHIDPHLTKGKPEEANAYFADFVRQLHEAGIRVILDGVFNHCSSSHPFFVNAKNDPESPCRKYFRFGEDGAPEYWWNVRTLPKFNYEEAPELEDYMMGIAAKWVSAPYNCDGWRLDVAADLGHSEEYNHHFWKRFRETVRKANPQAVVLAEHYDDPEAWIRNGEWDTVMNYRGFMEPVSRYLTGMDRHSDSRDTSQEANVPQFWNAVRKALRELGSGAAAFAAMNELDNHDHSRMITRTGKQTGRLHTAGVEKAGENLNYGLYKAAAVLLYTMPGAPTVYYGDETALPGWTDPDNRRPYPWGKENRELISFFGELARIHKSDAFRYGSLEVMETEEIEGAEPYAAADKGTGINEEKDGNTEKHIDLYGRKVLAYLRKYGDEAFLILINPTAEKRIVRIETEENAVVKVSRILYTTPETVSLGEKPAKELPGGMFVSRMDPYGTKIYHITLRQER